MITSKQIQSLREKTGIGIMECKKALEEAKGDEKKATEILKKSGAMKALKKSDRPTTQGIVETYSHGEGRIGVMVEVNTETDFVARNEEFKQFVHDVAMQIASMNPKDVESLKKQDFIKDLDITIGDLLTQKIQKIGENIKIKRFIRYELGE
jgi:elongation factor Ts